MHKRRLQVAVLSMTLVALLSACGQAKPPAQSQAPQNSTEAQHPAQGSQAQTSPPADENKQMTIKAYYGDEQGENLVEKQVPISFKQENDKYKAALEALANSPDPKLAPLFKGFTIRSVALKDKLLTVDVSMSPESRLGSGGEALLLQALKKTIFQFSEIDSFDLLLDGQAVESLMGHMDLPHPFHKSTP